MTSSQSNASKFSHAQQIIAYVLDDDAAAITDLAVSKAASDATPSGQSEVAQLAARVNKLEDHLNNFDSYADPIIEEEGIRKRSKVEARKQALRTETEADLKNTRRSLDRLEQEQAPPDINVISFDAALEGLVQLAGGNTEIGLSNLSGALENQESLNVATRSVVNLLVYFSAYQFGHEQNATFLGARTAVLESLQVGRYPDNIIAVFTRFEGKSPALLSSDMNLLIASNQTNLLSDAFLFAVAAGTDQQASEARAVILQTHNNDTTVAAQKAIKYECTELAIELLEQATRPSYITVTKGKKTGRQKVPPAATKTTYELLHQLCEQDAPIPTEPPYTQFVQNWLYKGVNAGQVELWPQYLASLQPLTLNLIERSIARVPPPDEGDAEVTSYNVHTRLLMSNLFETFDGLMRKGVKVGPTLLILSTVYGLGLSLYPTDIRTDISDYAKTLKSVATYLPTYGINNNAFIGLDQEVRIRCVTAPLLGFCRAIGACLRDLVLDKQDKQISLNSAYKVLLGATLDPKAAKENDPSGIVSGFGSYDYEEITKVVAVLTQPADYYELFEEIIAEENARLGSTKMQPGNNSRRSSISSSPLSLGVRKSPFNLVSGAGTDNLFRKKSDGGIDPK